MLSMIIVMMFFMFIICPMLIIASIILIIAKGNFSSVSAQLYTHGPKPKI